MRLDTKITDGLWVADMSNIPYMPDYEAVCTVSEDAGHVDERIKHRHIYMTDSDQPQSIALDDAVGWVRDQWEDGKKVLVRSENGVNRPGYVVAALFIDMGADPDEAVASVRRRVPDALQNDHFIDFLTEGI